MFVENAWELCCNMEWRVNHISFSNSIWLIIVYCHNNWSVSNFVCCKLMEALLSTLAFRRVPTVERTKKRRKEEQDAEQVSRKRPKLLEDILSGENPPTLVPSYTSKGVQCKLAFFYPSPPHMYCRIYG